MNHNLSRSVKFIPQFLYSGSKINRIPNTEVCSVWEHAPIIIKLNALYFFLFFFISKNVDMGKNLKEDHDVKWEEKWTLIRFFNVKS